MNQKTAIVTGASRGIGRAAALLFAKNGYNVVLTYKENEAAAISVEREIIDLGGEAALFQYDTVCSEAADSLVGFTVGRYGKINALINNAGESLRKLMTETTDEDWNRIIAADLSGVFYLSRAAAKVMIGQRAGSVVNVSSIHGICGASMETAYSAAKAGVIGFTKALARELAPSGITVNCVAPGVVETGMNSFLSADETTALRRAIPMGRFGTPDEIAETILFLAESRYITAGVICADGGYI